MTKIKFIHTGDLHLDTPFKGLQNLNSDLAKRLADATMKSFSAIVDLCIAQKVDFLLITGDIFDSEIKSLAAQLRFVSELKRLSSHNISAFLITGNHDPLNSWMKELEMPEGVVRFGSEAVSVASWYKNGKRIADIYGLSYADKTVEENLALQYALVNDPAPVNIAMLHGTIGSPGPHHSYAPFSMADIRSKGFDYWALGHIHKHQVLQPANPAVVYPGNPQGRDFGETGSRGCYLVELEENRTPRLTFMPTQQIRFEEIIVNLSSVENINALTNLITSSIENIDGHLPTESYVVRVILTGRTPLHTYLRNNNETEGLMELLNEGMLHRQYFTWIDRIVVQTQPDVDLESLRKTNDFTAAILNAFQQLKDQPEHTAVLLEEIQGQFAAQVRKDELGDLTDEEIHEMIEKAQWMIVDQLLTPQP